jgi:hypothetical protein
VRKVPEAKGRRDDDRPCSNQEQEQATKRRKQHKESSTVTIPHVLLVGFALRKKLATRRHGKHKEIGNAGNSDCFARLCLFVAAHISSGKAAMITNTTRLVWRPRFSF